MGIVSNATLIVSGVYLALGLIYLRFWWAERARLAYLAFTIACLSYMVFAWFEFGMMKAATPEEYLSYAWWAFVVGGAGIVAFAWFAYLQLHGRKWLFVTYAAMRGLALVLHLIMANGINFRQITSVGQRTVLGETLTYPIPVPNPWMLLPHLSHIVLVVFFLDASVRCWRLGERRTALIFGTGTLLFGMATVIVPTGVLWGVVSVPLFASFSVLLIIIAMLYELNYDMHRAAMLGEKLEERDAQLTETVDQLQMTASAGNVGMWIRSIDGEIIWASEKAGEIWGFPGGMRFTQDDLIEKLHPDDHERVIACVGALATGKEDYLIEFRILGMDGNISWIRSQGRIETVDGNRTVRGALVDITKLKMAETRLTETLDQLQFSAAAANVGLWTRKVGEEKAWLSDKAVAVWGFPRGTEVGLEEVFRHIHPADRERYLTNIRELEEWKNEYQIDYRFLLNDGDLRWIHSRGKVETVNGSRIIRGAIVDITKLKMAEEAIHDLSGKLMNAQEKERARLARELHDDLSQSIALLSIQLSNLRNDPKDIEHVKHQLDRFVADVQRLSVDVHRISRELHPARLTQLGLESALRDFCRELGAAYSLEIDFEAEDLPRDLPQDISLCLYRVTQESLQNVIKHSRTASARVSVRSANGEVRLSISDSGSGFDPSATKAKGALGLISIDERVRAVDGTVRINSHVGVGTKIEVRLPIKQLDHSRNGTADAINNDSQVKIESNRIRVFVADDCKPILETIVGLLTPQYDVVGTAADGQAALEMIYQLKPDIAVLDISMPFKTGIEITADLKTSASEVKVVIISAHDEECYISAASDAGALSYVVKTNLADGLIPALESACAEKVVI